MEWGFILLLVLTIPVVIIWPLLVWVGAISGLYQLARSKVRNRARVQPMVAAAQKASRR
jgi:hypothetical protein